MVEIGISGNVRLSDTAANSSALLCSALLRTCVETDHELCANRLASAADTSFVAPALAHIIPMFTDVAMMDAMPLPSQLRNGRRSMVDRSISVPDTGSS